MNITKQSQSAVQLNQNTCVLLSTLNWKLFYEALIDFGRLDHESDKKIKASGQFYAGSALRKLVYIPAISLVSLSLPYWETAIVENQR